MSKKPLRPIAFMVMPFGKRRVSDTAAGAPKEVDFDALWDRVFCPALEECGYLAVRADADPGSVIVKDMIERLAFADLVLADITLPNGNVYYEVGLRHAARKDHCILIAANWSKPLFDVAQMRTHRYSLQDGTVPAKEAESIRHDLIKHIPTLIHSLTPYYTFISEGMGFSNTVFRDHMERISDFQAEIRAVRLETEKKVRNTRVQDLLKHYSTGRSLEMREISFELLTLVRDTLAWGDVLAFIERLPVYFQNDDYVREQRCLAQSKNGDHTQAIAGLEELIALRGESAERRGLLGGRYKKRWREAREERQKKGETKPCLIEQRHLDHAIENYRRGMNLNLNEYYCVCNLPGLLRERNGAGDEEEADFLDRLTVLAAHRKIERGEDDDWARSTLLGAAFRVGDLADVKKCIHQVEQEGPILWMLATTLDDINDAIKATPASSALSELEEQRDRLMGLVQPQP